MNINFNKIIIATFLGTLCLVTNASAEVQNLYIEKVGAKVVDKKPYILLYTKNPKKVSVDYMAFVRNTGPVLTNFSVNHSVDSESGLDVYSSRIDDEFIGKPYRVYIYPDHGVRVSNLVSFCFKSDGSVCDGFVSENIPYLDHYNISFENDLPKTITLTGKNFTKDMNITINTEYYIPNQFVTVSSDGTLAVFKIPDFVSSGMTLSKNDLSVSILGGLFKLKLSDVIKKDDLYKNVLSVYLRNKSKNGVILESFPIRIKFSTLIENLNSRNSSNLEGDDLLTTFGDNDELPYILKSIKEKNNIGMRLGTGNNIVFRDNEVTDLQKFLSVKGFLKEIPSGYFGKETKDALIKYQKSKGLPATGYFGNLTKKAILNEKTY